MRLLIIILLFSINAQGQIINASAPYRPFASVSLLLDTYTGAAAAYSLRKLRTAYSGSAIRVRRSNDNSEQDIGFTSAGDLDTASLKTFVGANNGFVVTWYDQSGNSRNATQSTAASQPQVIQSGVIYRRNSKPSVFFPGNNFVEHTLSSNISQPGTVFSALEYTELGSKIGLGSNNDASRWQMYRTNSNSSINIFSGTVLSSSNTTQSFILQYALFNGANSVISINGSSTTGNAGAQQVSSFRIGADASGSFFLSCYMSEIIIYNSNQSSNKTGIESNINTYYSIY
jgi:hypothetical protein